MLYLKHKTTAKVLFMKNFWTYIKNEKFAIGCTGQTVYVYDKNENELAKFKDLKYAYRAMFCPNKNIFAVKSTEPYIAFYSLDKMQLLKKIKLKNTHSPQDDGFCFSPDGKQFLNLEFLDDLTSNLVIYDTEKFEEIARIFIGENAVLNHIEYDEKNRAYYVLGYLRSKQDNEYCIFEIKNNKVIGKKRILEEQAQNLQNSKQYQLSGYTEKQKKWLDGDFTDATFAQIYKYS